MKEMQSVLIVDDQPRNISALEACLSELDVELVQTHNGNEALAAALDHRFALGILDVQRSGVDGCEVAQLLRSDSKTRDLPLIFLMASDGTKDESFRGHEAGAVDYIVKPYSKQVLLAKVRLFLQLDRQSTELRDQGLHLDELVRDRASDLQDATQALQIEKDIADTRTQELASTLATLKETEVQLAQAHKMDAIGRLAGGVAHDFNNLLVVIMGYAGFILEDGQQSERSVQDLQQILKAGESAATLTRQLLAFSRKQALELRVLDLNTIVGDLRKMLDRLIGEDISIVFKLAPDVHPVLADVGQLEQVIVNLALNARDAMTRGGKLLIETGNVELDESYAQHHLGTRPGAFAMFSVSDSGKGMDAATQAHLFEPFFTTKEVGRRIGLGLATVYGIVKQSGGSITVTSELGIGTTFKVYLPRTMSAGPSLGTSGPVATGRPGQETVLVVEDDAAVRALAARILKSLGYKVLEADGLARARQFAEADGEIHLLLTDVVMAGGSGRQVSAVVRSLHPEAKVLFMSGYTDEAILRHGVLDPNVAFLNKPFTRDSLGRKVRAVLD